MKQAEILISTASAIARAISDYGLPWGLVPAAMAAAMGAAQLAVVSSATYQGGASAAPSAEGGSLTIGKRDTSVDLAKSNMNVGGELGYLRGESGMGNNSSNYQVSPSRATGGRVTAGIPVGENGPELFIPDVPGNIISADSRSGGQPIHASISISAIDAYGVEELLSKQRGNIITMLREAANANGETFLESVNTQEYTPTRYRRV
jgi:hypothetical protein